MQHFRGTDFRAHTSCISEAQKYQGSLYRPDRSKDTKTRTKTPNQHNPPRKAYVEDVPDADSPNPLTSITSITSVAPPVAIGAPPHAPSPPPLAPSAPSKEQAVNVFDFLVADETPNASRVALAQPEPEPMKMVQNAPTVFESARHLQDVTTVNASRETFGESRYEETGFHYGEGPVPVMATDPRGYLTPAPAHESERARRRDREGEVDDKKDKKRKRVQVEELDLSAARPNTREGDAVMTDAPPVLHSGLTGGLKGLLNKSSEYPPSPDYSSGDLGNPSPGSPLKRSKYANGDKPNNAITALVPVSRHSSSRHVVSASRPHKHRRKHHRSHSTSHSSRKLKAIEYRKSPSVDDTQGQLVVYQSRAEQFLSFITKGPGSEKGYSINKALKRYHRERAHAGFDVTKGEEEKQLWKSLRLRRNERGEIVLFSDVIG
ncbi:MAG: hypothetical protein M1833_006396 [Piccolia ochrophora]|nr:MAG: hypothetical protein M1833_006396 [Piccolia ochrophora]